jgi:tyrosyl-tRNA synthetase
VPLLLLRRFQLFGHHPIALAGGATGMIGDPSGRSSERSLLDDETLTAYVAAIKAQLERFLDFDSSANPARLVDNRDWTAQMGVLDFLRDVGKHLTVNVMLAKESVKARVESDTGISYTEFSYMLLQANDYRWLHEHLECDLQVGGSDQWGNITAGIDLVRRLTGDHVHGLTVPLVTKADGTKFGKSAGENIWLDARRTSPYAMYQYFLNTDDRDVERFLLQLTLLPVDAVAEVMQAHGSAPDQREAQRVLAHEVTTLVHGEDATREAEQASSGFNRSSDELSAAELGVLVDAIPTHRVPRGDLVGCDLVDVLLAAGAVSSKGEARRLMAQSGITVNDEAVSASRPLVGDDLLHGRYVMLRRGKKQRFLVVAD